MTRSGTLFSASVWFAAAATMATISLTSPSAQAGCCAVPVPNNSTKAAVTLQGHSDPNLDFIDSNANSNIWIGGVGGFVGTGSGTIAGTVEFAAANTGQYSPDGITVTGGAAYGNAEVQTTLNTLTTLSQTFGTESGTPLTLSGGGSISASSGVLDSNGNKVFTATIGGTFTAGTTFTINGTSGQTVVVNIPTTGGLAFDGSIVLTGGITSDMVLFNFDSGDYDTMSGGDTLMINTAFNTTTGTFLDPNGPFVIDDSVIDGRIVGGGSSESGITSSDIVAPPAYVVPEPSSLVLLGGGLVAFSMIRRRRRPLPARS